MIPERIHLGAELHPGQAAEGRFYVGDCIQQMEAMLEEWSGRIKLIYMDPPYMTGDKYYMRLRVGERGWSRGRSDMQVVSFEDYRDRESYLAMMDRALRLCRQLLSEDGMIFVHIDYRAHPHLRLLMDDIFGEEHFLNEIIWVYQTGGRSLRHFSRKHDVILFYRKSADYDFNIDAVKYVPEKPRDNHMRRHVDADGRVYRSIRVGKKLYTYYDDEPVAPSDVWSDLSHLQQKDPERTGYDTQKPLALLDRIVRCASREGDWVLDPFAGSCTTLEAARKNRRNFIGIDAQPMTVNMARRRLRGANAEIIGAEAGEETPVCEASVYPGVGFYHVVLDRFEVDLPGLPEDAMPLDCVDNWAVGYLREDRLEIMEDTVRTRRHGALITELKVPVYSGKLGMLVSDLLGRTWYYALDPSGHK